MRVWFASFLLLFALAQLFNWMKHLSLPLPVFILGGLLLAIASNYNKRSGWPFCNQISNSEVKHIEAPTDRLD
ncbi:hypothetical protein IQ264_00610 [Phormidium sp. LEGE 05292]|uniref:hypothetical protein n=1 Tax=[Phormidium] sp. LEGE 05292 TaxID=767427 RepID=UPI001881BFE3|nr:hypothetical protein [Phormidium sp. LEGE 05292]MBE9223978.1 hypothetical protein [Phormidium sp. LEGE 05292]